MLGLRHGLVVGALVALAATGCEDGEIIEPAADRDLETADPGEDPGPGPLPMRDAGSAMDGGGMDTDAGAEDAGADDAG